MTWAPKLHVDHVSLRMILEFSAYCGLPGHITPSFDLKLKQAKRNNYKYEKKSQIITYPNHSKQPTR
jgi:hypothetical protein